MVYMRELFLDRDKTILSELIEEAKKYYPAIFHTRTVLAMNLIDDHLLKIVYDDGSWSLYDSVSKRTRYISKTKIKQVRSGKLDKPAWRYAFSVLFNRVMLLYDISQRELSEKSGISERTISEYSRGEAVPTGFSFYKLARAIGCPEEELTDISLYYYGFK